MEKSPKQSLKGSSTTGLSESNVRKRLMGTGDRSNERSRGALKESGRSIWGQRMSFILDLKKFQHCISLWILNLNSTMSFRKLTSKYT